MGKEKGMNIPMKRQRFIYQLANSVIRLMTAAIVFVLFLHSIYSTSFVGRAVREDGSAHSRTLNIPDSPWKHLVVFLAVTLLGLAAAKLCGRWRKSHSFSAWDDRKVLAALCCLLFGAGVLWIVVTQLKPGSDPAKVYAIALEWREGDFSAFEEGNYLFCYPFQSGIVLFYYLLTFLFGTKSYVGPQIVNALLLVVIYLMFSLMARSFWDKDRRIPVFVYLALMGFIPLFFFITYLYGILPGMACGVGTMYLAVCYLKTRRYRYMAGAALCIGLATVLKMNCLIYLVAVACFMAYDVIDTLLADSREKRVKEKWIGSAVFVLLMILSVWGCSQLTKRCVERLSGYDMPEGEVMVSWAVMGLQEAPKGPGDYNGYIGDVFVKNHYDTELATKQSLEDLRRILERMAENPLDEGVTFFARKTAYQWNDPTFISMERMRGRKSAVRIPAWVKSLIEGRGSVMLSVWLNYVQTLVLLGILFYLVLNWNSENLYELSGVVVFLGGFLFHLVWEAGASYTIPYFTIMIPYAVKGFCDWIRLLDYRLGNRRADWKFSRKTAVLGAAAVMAAALTIAFTKTNLFHRTIALDDGAEAVRQYYQIGADVQ